MLMEILTEAFIISLLAGAVRIATPILFAAMGELITERSGVLNLGLEGIILLGAFTSFVYSFFSDSLLGGVLVAAATGLFLGGLFSFLVTTLKSNQTITGLALNIFCQGIAFYFYRLAFRDVGTGQVPTIETFDMETPPQFLEYAIVGNPINRKIGCLAKF